MDVAVEHGRRTIQLQADQAYVMHDVEAMSGIQAGALDLVEPFPTSPALLSADRPAKGDRLLMPFIGGLGDALSTLPILAELKRRRPGLTVHVATTPGPAELFALSGVIDELLPYPLTVDDWRRFDAVYTLESVHRTGQKAGRALPVVFADAIGLELSDMTFDLRIPGIDPETASAPRPADQPPMVGIAVPDVPSPRAYPVELLRSLLLGLRDRGCAAVLLGNQSESWPIAEDPPMLTDLRSKTPRLLELATWLMNLDVLVAHDSFIMHFAGALGRPMVVLSGPTSPAHADVYPSARTIASALDCAPCHAAVGGCPLGHERCLAWDEPHVAAGCVIDAVMQAAGVRPMTPRSTRAA